MHVLLCTICSFYTVIQRTYNTSDHLIGSTADAGLGWLAIVSVSGADEDSEATRSELHELSVWRTSPLSVKFETTPSDGILCP